MLHRRPENADPVFGRHSASLNPINKKGWTPLTIAQGIFWRRWPEMEAVLVDLGATSPPGTRTRPLTAGSALHGQRLRPIATNLGGSLSL